jgi:hypothetical protein
VGPKTNEEESVGWSEEPKMSVAERVDWNEVMTCEEPTSEEVSVCSSEERKRSETEMGCGYWE